MGQNCVTCALNRRFFLFGSCRNGTILAQASPTLKRPVRSSDRSRLFHLVGSSHSNCSSSTSASSFVVWSDVRPHFAQNHSWISLFQRTSACCDAGTHL